MTIILHCMGLGYEPICERDITDLNYIPDVGDFVRVDGFRYQVESMTFDLDADSVVLVAVRA